MDRDPYFGATGKRRDPGYKCWQSFLQAEVDIFAGQGLWQRTRHAVSAEISTV